MIQDRNKLILVIKNINPSVYKVVMDGYPDLEGTLELITKGNYSSYGYRMIFLDYNLETRKWSMMFRNPVEFDNPVIEADTPLEAAHLMLDFCLNRIIIKTNENIAM